MGVVPSCGIVYARIDVHIAVPVCDFHCEIDVLRAAEGDVLDVPSVEPGVHRVVVLEGVVASLVKVIHDKGKFGASRAYVLFVTGHFQLYRQHAWPWDVDVVSAHLVPLPVSGVDHPSVEVGVAVHVSHPHLEVEHVRVRVRGVHGEVIVEPAVPVVAVLVVPLDVVRAAFAHAREVDGEVVPARRESEVLVHGVDGHVPGVVGRDQSEDGHAG